MKKPKTPPKNAAGRVPEPAVNNGMSIAQAAEVPAEEQRERRIRSSISDYHLRHATDTELGIRPEDRSSFMLGWLACAERVRGALRGHE